MPEKGYYSQSKQDKFIIETYFPTQMGGIFVDIGANDGINLSNTYAFERRGWKGYCIEPLDDVFELLVMNRPESVCIKGIISDVTGESEFLSIEGYAQMLSGELKKYHPDHLKRVDNEIEEYGGKKTLIQVKSYRFEDIIHTRIIDYLSIDVEGGEFDIIKSIDFKKYFIKFISVENNYKDSKMLNYIRASGFDHLVDLDGDHIFKNKEILH